MAPLLELAALRLVRGSSGCTCQGGRTGGGETIAVRAENRVNGAAPSFQTNICLIPIEIDTKKGKVGHWCGSARAGWLAGASHRASWWGLLKNIKDSRAHDRQPWNWVFWPHMYLVAPGCQAGCSLSPSITAPWALGCYTAATYNPAAFHGNCHKVARSTPF